MEDAELLTVEESFDIEGRGLWLHPNFSVPVSGWDGKQTTVTIVPPSGKEFETVANLSMTHFRLSDPNALSDKRWRVTVMLPDCDKEKVPVGSIVRASKEITKQLI